MLENSESNKIYAWVRQHVVAVAIGTVLILLGLVELLPPIESFFVWQRRLEAAFEVSFGILNSFFLLPFYRLPFLIPPLIFHIVILITCSVIYGLLLEKLLRFKVGWIVALGLVVLNSFYGCFVVGAASTLVGDPYTCETMITDEVRVKLVTYPERGFLPGANYFFMESRNSGNRWHQIMYSRSDDPQLPPCQNIKYLSEDHYWVWMWDQFAVTVDGGKTWNEWQSTNGWASGECCNYGLIEDVEFSSSTSGRMFLNPVSGRNPATELITMDGGITWKEP
jgi:hypothetical protein